MIPPEQNADFVASMEDVLEVYHRPYDPKYPVVCLDEQPVQMVKETRQSIRCEPGKPERYDYQYERAGVANAFMFGEPLAGKRNDHTLFLVINGYYVHFLLFFNG